MAKPTRKLFMRIGAVVIFGAAGASAAIAADNTGASAGAFSAATNAVSKVSLPAAANETAALVHEAIAGGAGPSAVVSQRSEAGSRGQAKQASNESAVLISAAQRQGGAGTAGTVGTRPGWGCGDTNHTHSGPPGRPGATPPPGCQR
jgi:hypothetical protein